MMQAFADGKRIRCRGSGSSQWYQCQNPGWHDSVEYETTPPEPPAPREWWVVTNSPVRFDSAEDANNYASAVGGQVFHLIGKSLLPENPAPLECWVNEYPGCKLGLVRLSRGDAVRNAGRDVARTVHMREVTDES